MHDATDNMISNRCFFLAMASGLQTEQSSAFAPVSNQVLEKMRLVNNDGANDGLDIFGVVAQESRHAFCGGLFIAPINVSITRFLSLVGAVV